MMLKWYKENPIDGKEIARAIQVGLPPDEDCKNEHDDQDSLQIGLTVPEADREVVKTHISLQKDIAVTALPLEGLSHQVMVDLSNSSPKRLPQDETLATI